VTIAILLILPAFIYLLYKLDRRIERLETLTANLLPSIERLGNAALRRPAEDVNRVHITDSADATKVLEDLGRRIYRHAPALRRVLNLSVGLSRDFLGARGIRDDDLQGLDARAHLAPEVLWPATDLTIEFWSTHTVITDLTGYRKVVYAENSSWPLVLWKHDLPTHENEYGTASLEVVLYQGSLKVWAVGGRFGRRIPPEPVPPAESIWVEIPTNAAELEKYRIRPPSTEDPELEFYFRETSWETSYSFEDPDERFRWVMTVYDMVRFVQERE
jgi:hypothetical protein